MDDAVSADVRAELQKHLSGCEHCEVTLSTTRKTIQIYRSHEIYDLPAGLRERPCIQPSWRGAKKGC